MGVCRGARRSSTVYMAFCQLGDTSLANFLVKAKHAVGSFHMSVVKEGKSYSGSSLCTHVVSSFWIFPITITLLPLPVWMPFRIELSCSPPFCKLDKDVLLCHVILMFFHTPCSCAMKTKTPKIKHAPPYHRSHGFRAKSMVTVQLTETFMKGM